MPGITDLRAYATLQTDDLPRFLARDSQNRIIIDSGVQVGTLSGNSQGACMIPYRPNASPQSWMYIGAQEDYRKYSAPDIVTGGVTELEVGIQEQQDPPEACPNNFGYVDYMGAAVSWTNAGTAGAPSNTTRLSDTAGTVILDPACGTSFDSRGSVQITDTKSYQIGMALTINSKPAAVQDILPAVNRGTAITIKGIYYISGTTGRCVIVPTQGPVATPFQNIGDPAPSLYDPSPLSSLRRGSLVTLTGGAGTEILFVLSSTVGPDGTICFEVTTTLAFVAGDSITGVPAISLSGVATTDSGSAIDCPDISYAITTGVGTMSEALSFSPFNIIGIDGQATTQQYDYLGFGIQIDNLSALSYVKFIFNVDPTVDYATNAFYTQLDVSDFGPNNDGSSLPANQATFFMIPISSLNRIGQDQTKTLSDTNGMRVEIQCTANINVRIGRFWVGIGHQPDVGPDGSPYFYAARTRNALTGASSNPTPVTRYGVGPRRQSVRIICHDSSSGTQGDQWDIYRMGGKVNTFRYLGSMLNTGGNDVFIDNYFDTAALGGSLIEYDNFQPWPTIDEPFNLQWGGGGGISVRITVVGTVLEIVWYSASSFANPAPDTILRWLPGTLVRLDGASVYTLWDRPVLQTLASPPAAFYYAYRLRLLENANAFSPTTLNIEEPLVANQPLPYLWGPDAEGTVFGCGDTFRPGNVYFCKANTPDSAPDKYNLEITPPSEPLMGGETINGLSFVSSTERWWALYPSFQNVDRYQKVEQPVRRGMIAPYAKCTDKRVIYFVAKDGIWSTGGQSLTDRDLWNLFPHEGVPGLNVVYAGQTIYAPDYQYASEFRLAYHNFYLYFDYKDSDGLPRTLVCDLRNSESPAWSVDVYGDPITVHYATEQQAGTLLDASASYTQLVMGDANGVVHVQQDLSNDNGTPISGKVSVFEFNGGDVRGTELYNDIFIDFVPAAVNGVTLTGISGGSSVGTPKTFASSVSRVQSNLPVGLELSFLGVLIEWTDDFNSQDIATILRNWQPMFQPVPISVFLWKNQGTTFGMRGYKHLRQVVFAYKATSPVTITITVDDGTAPDPIVLPSTGGLLKKTVFPFTFNKGLIYFISATSEELWTPYNDETEFWVGAWERTIQYDYFHDVMAPAGL